MATKKILTDIDVANNLTINGATTPDWSGCIALKDKDDIGDNVSGQAFIYSSGGELHAMDASGNTPTLSSHIDGKWVYKCTNVVTGKTVQIHMEDLVKAIEEHLGKSFSEIVEPSE